MDTSNKYVLIKSTCFVVKLSMWYVSNDRMSRKCEQGHYVQATFTATFPRNSLLASNVPVSLWEWKEDYRATH